MQQQQLEAARRFIHVPGGVHNADGPALPVYPYQVAPPPGSQQVRLHPNPKTSTGLYVGVSMSSDGWSAGYSGPASTTSQHYAAARSSSGLATSTAPMQAQGEQMMRDAIPNDQPLLRMGMSAQEMPGRNRRGNPPPDSKPPQDSKSGVGRKKARPSRLGVSPYINDSPGPLTTSMRQMEEKQAVQAAVARGRSASGGVVDMGSTRGPGSEGGESNASLLQEAGTGELHLGKAGWAQPTGRH